MRAFGLMLLVVLFIQSCGQSDCRNVADLESPEKITIVRTESDLFKSQTVGDVIDYFKKYPSLANYFWHRSQYPSDTILAGRTFSLIKHPSTDTVYQESIQAFDAATNVEADLGEAFGRLKQLYPNAKTPKVYTAVSVFYNDLFVSDSVVVLGLDHFIGKDATYAPQDIPEYILQRYTADNIPAIAGRRRRRCGGRRRRRA